MALNQSGMDTLRRPFPITPAGQRRSAHSPIDAGVWDRLLALGREGVSMKWRVMVELGAADGTVQVHEVSSGECTVAACSAETLGLSIANGKTTLAGLQRQLVQAQTEEH